MEPSGRNRWQPGGKCVESENGEIRRKPLRAVATSSRGPKMVSRASAVGCDPLWESPPCEGGGRLRGAGLGERDVVAAADRAALDDVGIDTDIRFVVLRCGAQDAGVFR